jgi:rhodanese-related sulfurtransferase
LTVATLTGSETLVIIDVRDEDEVWHDGQIKGPVLHIPSAQFSSLANAKDIIRDHDLLTKEIIAVHCHKSQQRGPYCARLLAAAASELEEESAAKM